MNASEDITYRLALAKGFLAEAEQDWQIERLRGMLPDLMALGSAEHFMTDYGDEDQRMLPWDLFKQESAEDELTAARHAFESATALLTQWEGGA